MSTPSAPAFATWLDDFFAAYYRRHPVNATFIGEHAYDDLLPDLSESGIATVLAETDDLLSRLRQLPDEPLTTWQTLDRQLAEGFLVVQRWESSSLHFGASNPVQFTSEAIFGLVSLLLHPTPERVQAGAERLGLVADFLRTGMDQIHRAPEEWIDRAAVAV